MVDVQTTVCCMCGDVGFPEKLFRCTKCSNRFQHSYCSNYYIGDQVAEPIEQCNWCQSEERSIGGRSKPQQQSSQSGDKMKELDDDDDERRNNKIMTPQPVVEINKGKSPSSTRPTTRRYKLLKDVMC